MLFPVWNLHEPYIHNTPIVYSFVWDVIYHCLLFEYFAHMTLWSLVEMVAGRSN